MRIESVKINGFKNLSQFTIDLDKEAIHTVLIGQNAAGKSNFLEALVIIFKNLDLGEKKLILPDFDFDIVYRCKAGTVQILGFSGKDELNHGSEPTTKAGYDFFVNDIKMSRAAFYRNKNEHLPRYVFSYYSGVSNRLVEHFDTHQKHFRDELLKGNEKPLRPLFYARLIHSHFVLLAFFGFGEQNIDDFLKEYLEITGLESILFVLKKPSWPGDKKNGDPKFWFAKGVVKDFLNELWDHSMAPIPYEDTIRLDFDKNPKQEQLYLYISNQQKLEEIAQKYLTNTNFFKMLESTYLSDLIQEVRVKVKKENLKGNVTFKELSEGEQQLLTVLGLIRFTKEEDSLFLLDEPDTHLNPLWKWKYMSLLEKIVGENDNSQIIMTTHDPLVIGGLTKKEIRIFHTSKEDKRIYANEPEFDPRGLGVAGILTSDFFGLPTTLDNETLEVINQRNALIVKQDTAEGLNDQEKITLNETFQILGELGINTTDRDPLYEKFLIEMSKTDNFKIEKMTSEEIEEQNKVAKQIMDKLLKRDSE
ncbi:AAA family ATPase [Flavobacterium sp. UBA7680]|uniref:AAA family ATPase n=1 Tax=Flavobacterium sp. UBA7680 TaxID=1946559 RepID=UPI0025C1A7EA|nr:ATP-binding protein [Flavobacterium sp. UBA7680]